VNDPRSALLGDPDHVLGATRTVTRLAIPKGNHGQVSGTSTQGLAEEPQVISLPDVVVFLELQPVWELLGLGKHRDFGLDSNERVKPSDPVFVNVVDTGSDELVFRNRKQHFSGDAFLAYLEEQDVAAVCSSRNAQHGTSR